jgi:Membrane protein TerC, possibly involved in tellurium resistance
VTPLFLVVMLIEVCDVVFAVDSIPAIFAVTQDTFVVITSNVFAVLGLRALYFALAGLVHRFHYLKYGLSLVLVVIGVKMLIADLYHVPTWLALLITGLAHRRLGRGLDPAAERGAFRGRLGPRQPEGQAAEEGLGQLEGWAARGCWWMILSTTVTIAPGSPSSSMSSRTSSPPITQP